MIPEIPVGDPRPGMWPHNVMTHAQKQLVTRVISKQKVNKVILNFFIQEGFQDAAIALSEEAGISLDTKDATWAGQANGAQQILSQNHASALDFVKAVKTYSEATARSNIPSVGVSTGPEVSSEAIKGYSSMEKRREIKYLILKGDITSAIRTISTYFPTVLDSNNLLLFKILRLNLIEMIREHKFSPDQGDDAAERKFLDDVLQFVRKNLVNKVIHSFELLKELETTMSLLCFDFDPSKPVEELTSLPEELKKLFDLSLRTECYRVVNRAILDLEVSDSAVQQYKGMTFAEFSPAMLQKLPQAEPLETADDVDMTDSDLVASLDTSKGIESMISFAPSSPEQAEPILFTKQKAKRSQADQAALESQLERIAKLWIATEQRLLGRGMISQKRYYASAAADKTSL